MRPHRNSDGCKRDRHKLHTENTKIVLYIHDNKKKYNLGLDR